MSSNKGNVPKQPLPQPPKADIPRSPNVAFVNGEWKLIWTDNNFENTNNPPVTKPK